MSNDQKQALERLLRAANAASPFNALAGFEIAHIGDGEVTLTAPADPRLLSHAGLLHAGVQSALIDTACGYAAATVAGNVVTVQMSLSFVAAAQGERFEARARVTKAGRTQIFAEAQLYAGRGGEEALAAIGSAVLVRVG